MRAQTVFENLNFTERMPLENTLNIESYRSRIPWDNLPERGLYKILAGDNNNLDSALVLITKHDEAFIIQDWLENGGNWASDWFSGELLTNFKTFLEDNNAFNILEMEILNTKKPPGWDNIRMIEDER